MNGTIKLAYSAPSNINFRGEIDTEIPAEDWQEMSPDEQASVIDDCVGELIEIGVKGE